MAIKKMTIKKMTYQLIKKKTKGLVRANNKLYCQDSRNRFKPTKTIP